MLKDCKDEQSQKQTCPNVLTRLSIPKSPRHIKFKSSFSLNIFYCNLVYKGVRLQVLTTLDTSKTLNT